MLRPGDCPDLAVPELDEMLCSELGPFAVIDHDRIDIPQSRLTIQVHKDRARSLKPTEKIQIGAGRAIDNGGYFSFQQKLESSFLLGAVFIGIANQEGVPVCPGFVFNCLDDIREEK